jgi:molybdopterin molybdotransferase
MISIAQALRHVRNSTTEGPAVAADIRDTLGLVLARDVRSRCDVPAFANSAMDGYAVRAADTRGASRRRPVELRVVETIRAGDAPRRRVRRGEASAIMTGAPMPPGANAVLVVERTARRGDGAVRCFAPARAGEHIRRAGEDVRRGARVLRRGTVIRPQEMGMLAAIGATRVPVIRRPRVALVSTGSELVDAACRPRRGQVRDCNRLSLRGLVLKYGGIPVEFGFAGDDPGEIRRRLRRAAAACDIVVTSGGVSVGGFDLVRRVLAGMGAREIFWRVRMKPGKPVAFGLLGKKPFFGLPGNPVSAIVTFEIFVRPALRAMMGRRRLDKPVITAILGERLEKPPDRVHLIRARVERRRGRWRAVSTGPQGSGILGSLTRADGLIVLPQQTTAAAAGSRVRVMMLDWPEV